MAQGIEVSLSHFKQFNTVLTKFEQNVESVTQKLVPFNQGFITLGNAFNNNNLNAKMTEFSKAIKTFSRIDTSSSTNLFKIATAMNDIKNIQIPPSLVTGLDSFTKAIRSLSKMSSTGTGNISKLSEEFIRLFVSLNVGDDVQSKVAVFAEVFKGLSDITKNLRISSTSGLKGIIDIVNVLRTVVDLNLDRAKISSFAQSMRMFTEVFVGNGSFFSHIGVFKRLDKFSTGQLQSFSAFTKGISELLSAMRNMIKVGPIDINQINQIGNSIAAFVKSFTGPSGIERIGSIFQKTKTVFGAAFNTNPGSMFKVLGDTLGAIGNAFKPSIMGRITKLKDVNLEGFGRFARGLINMVNALKEVSVIGNVNDEAIKRGIKSLIDIVDAFTRQGNLFQRLFGIQSVLKVLDNVGGKGGFASFGKGLAEMATAMTVVATIKVGTGGIKTFVSNIQQLVNGINKIKVGRGAAGVTQMISEISKVMANLNLNGVDLRGLKNVGVKMAKTTLEGFAQEAQIRSPSRVMARFGGDLISGLSKGISSGLGALANLGKTIATRVFNGFKSVISGRNPFSGVFGNMFKRAGNEFDAGARGFEQKSQSILTRAFNGLKNIGMGGLGVNFIGQMFSGIGNSMNAALDFESGMSDVFKTVSLDDLSAEQAATFMEGFSDEIRRMATSKDSNLSGLSDAFGTLFSIGVQAGSAGVAKEDLNEFIETIGELTLSSDLTAEQGTAELASFATVTGTTEYRKLGSTIVELGNQFNATESQIVSFGQRLSGISASSNLSEADILALGTAMASVGIESEAGGSSMNQFVSEITKAAAGMQGGTVSAEQYTASLQENQQALMERRREAERDFLAAQDRINRLTENSALGTRFNAEDALAKAQAEMAAIDAQLNGVTNKLATAPTTGMIEMVGSASKELQAFAQVAGLSAKDFAQQWQDAPIEVLQKLIDGFAEMSSQEQVMMFEELGIEGVRMTDMIRRLAGAEGLLAGAVDTANAAWEENTALTEEAEKRNATGRSALNRLSNTFKLLKITVQELALDGFKNLLNGINDVLLKVINFIDVNKELIQRILPQLIKFIGLFGTGLALSSLRLGGLLKIATTIISPLLGMLKAFTSIVSIFFNPIGLIAAFAGLKIVPAIFQELTDTTSGTRNVFGELFTVVGNIANGLLGLIDTVGRLIGGIIGVRDETKNATTAIETFFAPILNFFNLIAEGIQGMIENLQLVGQALGIDMGLVTNEELTREQEMNAAIEKRKFLLADPSALIAGTIDGSGGTGTPATEAYKIKPGDTLGGIAQAFGFTVAELQAANPLIENPNLIFAGKEIAIPIKITDADGNEITPSTATPIVDAITNSADVETWLEPMDRMIAGMSEAKPAEEMTTLLDRLESLEGTDIFTSIFGDDEQALSRAVEQVGLIQTSIDLVKQGAQGFVDTFTTFLEGDWTSTLGNLKDAALDLAEGVAGAIAGIFDLGKRDGPSQNLLNAQSIGISDNAFGGISPENMAGSGADNPALKAVTEFFDGLREALSFVDDIDLTGVQTFINDIIQMISNFAGPVFESAKSIVDNQLAPLLNTIFGIFSGGEGGEGGGIDTSGLANIGTLLGEIAGGIMKFLGAVVGVGANLVGSTVKLILDLFTGIGSLIGDIASGEADVLGSLNTYLFQPLMNFAENLVVGTLDQVIAFLENLTGIDLPTGAELFGEIINFFEDFVNRFKVAMLDLQIEAARVSGNWTELERLTDIRGFEGLSDVAIQEMQAALDSGVELDLSKAVKFTFNGIEFTGTIGELISGSMGNMQDTATTAGNQTLIDTAQNLFNQFLSTGDSETLGAVIDIYDMLGRPKLGFDPTKIDISDIGDAATIADGLISRVLNLEGLDSADVNTLTGTSSKIQNVIRNVFAQALNDESLGATTGERLANANTLLYDLIDANATLDDTQKGILVDKVDGMLSEFYLALGGVDLNAQATGKDIVDGMATGITNNAPTVNQAGTDMANGLLGAMNEQLGIQSPSTKMIEMGNNLVAGLIAGLAGTEESNLVNAIKINLIDPFMKFDLAIQLVIISVQSLIDRLLLLGTTPGGDQVLPLIAGGKKYGGTVAAGSIYEVLEDKLPFEMYKTKSGKSYFMPNEDGEIISPFAAGNNSTMRTEPKAAAASGNTYYEIDQSISVPVVFENVPVGMSDQELNKIAETMGNKIQQQIKLNAKKNTVNDRLARRGYS